MGSVWVVYLKFKRYSLFSLGHKSDYGHFINFLFVKKIVKIVVNVDINYKSKVKKKNFWSPASHRGTCPECALGIDLTVTHVVGCHSF